VLNWGPVWVHWSRATDTDDDNTPAEVLSMLYTLLVKDGGNLGKHLHSTTPTHSCTPSRPYKQLSGIAVAVQCPLQHKFTVWLIIIVVVIIIPS
jgi:hypothetical protein